jgi:hypothetical protein
MAAQAPPPRLPARVYWVRRLVVLGIPLLVVVLVITWFSSRGGDSSAEPTPTITTPAPEVADAAAPAPSAPPTTEPGGVADCDATTLTIAMTATAESFGPGAPATFNVSITNTGSVPCLVDAGEASREIVITSGPDRVWSNRDCIAEGTQTRDLLLPEGGADTTQLAWNRVRSAPGCPPDLPAPGAGTYSAQFTVAGAAAAPAVFGLG